MPSESMLSQVNDQSRPGGDGSGGDCDTGERTTHLLEGALLLSSRSSSRGGNAG